MPAITWIETGVPEGPFLEQHIALLAHAVAQRPGEAVARRRLTGLLRAAGRADEAVDLHLAHLQRQPADEPAWCDLGAILVALGRFEEAEAALARVHTADLRPIALARRGLALSKLRRFDEAEADFRAALELDPDEPLAVRGVGARLIHGGDPEALEAHCRAAMRRIGAPAWLISHLTVSLAQQDRADELRALIDFERQVWVTDLDAPADYASLADFNGALAAALAARSRFQPVDRDWDTPVRTALLARNAGRAARRAETDDVAPNAVIEQAFRAELQRRVDACDLAADHPQAIARPQAASLHVVSHILRTGGHIEPHIHPSAWVNAVYYVEMPREVTQSPTAAGWLHFGPPPYDDPRLARHWPTARIEPKPGRLVIFPSYFSHRVTPVEVEQNRTTIAFEVSPAALAA